MELENAAPAIMAAVAISMRASSPPFPEAAGSMLLVIIEIAPCA